MVSLAELAAVIGVHERTLRRAADRGLIRAARRSPRKLELPPLEWHYVSENWHTLAALLRVLRTRHDVRLAVVYGSFARGDHGHASDIDLVLNLAGRKRLGGAGLARALEAETGRRIQLTLLEDVREAPLLLADVLRDGRVLVDRDHDWPRLVSNRRRIERAAAESDAALDAEIGRFARALDD